MSPNAWLSLLAGGLPLAFATAATWSGDIHAAHEHGDSTKADRGAAWRKVLARPPLAATAAFDARGHLWLISAQDGYLWLRRSDDGGKHFTTVTRVNAEPALIAADGENRPKLGFGPRGEIYVSWTQLLAETPFAGHVRLARSLDTGGLRFAPPVTVNADTDPVSHRFDSLLVDPRGFVHVFWLDKRDQHRARSRGVGYQGAALYHAVSTDGLHFEERKIADHSCECCRIAAALDIDGVPVVLWRHVFDDNIRDHALMRLDGRSPLVRASHDGWRLDGCPHHGPALSIGPDGVYHLAWFTGAPGRAGLYYRRAFDAGRRLGDAMPFGDPAAQPGRPQVLSLGRVVWLA